MARQIEEIFNECIERLRQGDSIENCLANYPEVAPELEMLLRTALNVNWRASMVRPRPEFKAYARAQLRNVQYAMSQERQPSRQPRLFSLRHAWVPALAMVVILLFSSVGTAAAAANAMPDEPLYSVKLVTEQVRMSFAFSDEARADLNVKLAETRSQEIATMATHGKTEQVIVVTDRLAQHIEAVEQAIRKVEEAKQAPPPPKLAITAPAPAPTPAPTPAQPPTTAPTVPPPPPDKPKDATERAGVQQTPSQESTRVTVAEAEKLRRTLKATISKNLTVLENARDKSPEQSKQALQKAIDLAKTRQLQWQQQPDTVPPVKPGTQPPTTGPGQTTPNPQNVPDSTGTKGSQEPTQRPDSQGSGKTPVTPSPTTPVSPKGPSSYSPPSTSTTTPPSSSTDSTNNTLPTVPSSRVLALTKQTLLR